MSTYNNRIKKQGLSLKTPERRTDIRSIFNKQDPNTPDPFASPAVHAFASNVFDRTPVEQPIENLDGEFDSLPGVRLDESFMQTETDIEILTADQTLSQKIVEEIMVVERHIDSQPHEEDSNNSREEVKPVNTSSVGEFYERQAAHAHTHHTHSAIPEGDDHSESRLHSSGGSRRSQSRDDQHSDLPPSQSKIATPERAGTLYSDLASISGDSNRTASLASVPLGSRTSSFVQDAYPFNYGDVVWSQSDPHFPFWPVYVFDPDHLPVEIQKQFKINNNKSPALSASGSLQSTPTRSGALRKKVPVYMYSRNDFELAMPSKIKDYKTHREALSKQEMSGSLSVLFHKAIRIADEEYQRDADKRVAWLAKSQPASGASEASLHSALLSAQASSRGFFATPKDEDATSVTSTGSARSHTRSTLPRASSSRVSPTKASSHGAGRDSYTSPVKDSAARNDRKATSPSPSNSNNSGSIPSYLRPTKSSAAKALMVVIDESKEAGDSSAVTPQASPVKTPQKAQSLSAVEESGAELQQNDERDNEDEGQEDEEDVSPYDESQGNETNEIGVTAEAAATTSVQVDAPSTDSPAANGDENNNNDDDDSDDCLEGSAFDIPARAPVLAPPSAPTPSVSSLAHVASDTQAETAVVDASPLPESVGFTSALAGSSDTLALSASPATMTSDVYVSSVDEGDRRQLNIVTHALNGSPKQARTASFDAIKSQPDAHATHNTHLGFELTNAPSPFDTLPADEIEVDEASYTRHAGTASDVASPLSGVTGSADNSPARGRTDSLSHVESRPNILDVAQEESVMYGALQQEVEETIDMIEISLEEEEHSREAQLAEEKVDLVNTAVTAMGVASSTLDSASLAVTPVNVAPDSGDGGVFTFPADPVVDEIKAEIAVNKVSEYGEQQNTENTAFDVEGEGEGDGSGAESSSPPSSHSWVEVNAEDTFAVPPPLIEPSHQQQVEPVHEKSESVFNAPGLASATSASDLFAAPPVTVAPSVAVSPRSPVKPTPVSDAASLFGGGCAADLFGSAPPVTASSAPVAPVSAFSFPPSVVVAAPDAGSLFASAPSQQTTRVPAVTPKVAAAAAADSLFGGSPSAPAPSVTSRPVSVVKTASFRGADAAALFGGSGASGDPFGAPSAASLPVPSRSVSVRATVTTDAASLFGSSSGGAGDAADLFGSAPSGFVPPPAPLSRPAPPMNVVSAADLFGAPPSTVSAADLFSSQPPAAAYSVPFAAPPMGSLPPPPPSHTVAPSAQASPRKSELSSAVDAASLFGSPVPVSDLFSSGQKVVPSAAVAGAAPSPPRPVLYSAPVTPRKEIESVSPAVAASMFDFGSPGQHNDYASVFGGGNDNSHPFDQVPVYSAFDQPIEGAVTVVSEESVPSAVTVDSATELEPEVSAVVERGVQEFFESTETTASETYESAITYNEHSVLTAAGAATREEELQQQQQQQVVDISIEQMQEDAAQEETEYQEEVETMELIVESVVEEDEGGEQPAVSDDISAVEPVETEQQANSSEFISEPMPLAAAAAAADLFASSPSDAFDATTLSELGQAIAPLVEEATAAADERYNAETKTAIEANIAKLTAISRDTSTSSGVSHSGPPPQSTSAKFIGRAPVLAGASPFDLPSAGPAAASLFESSGANSDPFAVVPPAIDLFSAPPPLAAVPSPAIATTGSVYRPVGGAKKTLVTAEEVFQRSARVEVAAPVYDHFSGPPPAPGVKVAPRVPATTPAAPALPVGVPMLPSALSVEIPANSSKQQAFEMTHTPTAAAVVPTPTSTRPPSGSMSATKKKNNHYNPLLAAAAALNNASATGQLPAGLHPTPHGLAPAVNKPAVSAVAPPPPSQSRSVSAPLVNSNLLSSLVSVTSSAQESQSVADSTNSVCDTASVTSSVGDHSPTTATTVGPPRPPGVMRGVSGSSAYSGPQRTFAVSAPPVAFVPGAKRVAVMKPPAAIATFGFGGKLLTMFPIAQTPINPLLPTPDQQARPYLPGKLTTHRIIDLVKTHYSVKDSDCVAAVDETLVYPGTRNENSELYKQLTAFQGPLTAAVEQGNTSNTASFDTKLKDFIAYHVQAPVSAYLSPAYHKSCGVADREAFAQSERMLWSLVQIMLDTNGNMSDDSKSESKIVELLLRFNASTAHSHSLHTLFRSQQNSKHSASENAVEKSAEQTVQYQHAIEQMLLVSDRDGALALAMKEGDWAFALLLSSVCGQEKYRTVTKAYADAHYHKESPLHLLTQIYSNQGTQALFPSTTQPQLLIAAGPDGAPAVPSASKKFVAYTDPSISATTTTSAATGVSAVKSQETALSLWRDNLAAILSNKNDQWKHVTRGLGYRLQNEAKDIMAAHFAYLTSGCLSNYPESAKPTTDPAAAKAQLKKLLGNFTLLGCDMSQPRHWHMTDVVAISALRMTECLELMMLRRVSNLKQGGSGVGADSLPSIAAIGKSFSSMLGFGSVSATTTTTAASTAKDTTVSCGEKEKQAQKAAADDQETAHLRVKLLRVRAVLVPLKFRFAHILADFGLVNEAIAYTHECIRVSKEVTAYLESYQLAAAAAQAQANKGKKPTQSVTPRNNDLSTTNAASAAPTASNSSSSAHGPPSANGVRMVPSRVLSGAEELLHRLTAGVSHTASGHGNVPGQGHAIPNAPPTGSAQTGTSSSSGSSSWFNSIISQINLKDLVDGPEQAVPQGHGQGMRQSGSSASLSQGQGPSGHGAPPMQQSQSQRPQQQAGPSFSQQPPMSQQSGSGKYAPFNPAAAVPCQQQGGDLPPGPWGAAAPRTEQQQQAQHGGGFDSAVASGQPPRPFAMSQKSQQYSQHPASPMPPQSNNNIQVFSPNASTAAVSSGFNANPVSNSSSYAAENEFGGFVDVDLANNNNNSGGSAGSHFLGHYQPQQNQQSGAHHSQQSSGSTWIIGQSASNTPTATAYHSRNNSEAYLSAKLAPQTSQSQQQPQLSQFPQQQQPVAPTPAAQAAVPQQSQPQPQAQAQAATASSKPAQSEKSPAPASTSSKSFFSGWGIQNTIVKYLNPDAKVVTDENLGGGNEAYFDKKLNKWVFPGETQNDTPDPASMPPPTMPSVQSFSMTGPASTAGAGSVNSHHSSGGSLYSGSAGGGPGPAAGGGPPGSGAMGGAGGSSSAVAYDPIAAMMAPPSRRIPAPSAAYIAPGVDPSDPLAAMMAPPSRNAFSAFHQQSSAGTAGGSGVAPPPPSVNIWKPAPQPKIMQVTTPVAAAPAPSVISPSPSEVSLAATVGSSGTAEQQPEATDGGHSPPPQEHPQYTQYSQFPLYDQQQQQQQQPQEKVQQEQTQDQLYQQDSSQQYQQYQQQHYQYDLQQQQQQQYSSYGEGSDGGGSESAAAAAGGSEAYEEIEF